MKMSGNPSVYVIQGLTGQLDMWRNRPSMRKNFPELADAQFAAGAAPPCVLVYVDAWTSIGGSQYVDSPGTGKYHTYLCDEIVPWVDARYRTLAEARHRGIAGKSGLLTKHAQWAPASSECGSLERRPERLAGRACRNSWMFHVRSFSDAYGVSCRVRAEKSLGHRWVATPQGHTGGQLPGFPVPATGLLLGIRRGAGFGFPRRCAPVGTHGKHTGAAVSYV